MPDAESRRLPSDRERDLAERAASDPDAFGELFDHFAPRVHAFARRRCGEAAVADDITAATFERAWRSIATFRWRAGGFGAWIFRIAANQIADHHRGHASERSDRRLGAALTWSDATAPDGSDAVEADADAEELRVALDRLKPRHRRVLELFYLADLDHGEVAEVLGVSRPALRVRLHRALADLRKVLDRPAGDP